MWKVENRCGILWRVTNGNQTWGANKRCTKEQAHAIAEALNAIEYAKLAAQAELEDYSNID